MFYSIYNVQLVPTNWTFNHR